MKNSNRCRFRAFRAASWGNFRSRDFSVSSDVNLIPNTKDDPMPSKTQKQTIVGVATKFTEDQRVLRAFFSHFLISNFMCFINALRFFTRFDDNGRNASSSSIILQPIDHSSQPNNIPHIRICIQYSTTSPLSLLCDSLDTSHLIRLSTFLCLL